MRNTIGGATSSEATRDQSAADATGVGQCLTGTRSYATDYIQDKFSGEGILLIVELDDRWLTDLRAKANEPDSTFDTMMAAKQARECTVMVDVPVGRIFYALVGYPDAADSMSNIANFPTPAPLEDWEDWEDPEW